jgi:hypothetical protein
MFPTLGIVLAVLDKPSGAKHGVYQGFSVEAYEVRRAKNGCFSSAEHARLEEA